MDYRARQRNALGALDRFGLDSFMVTHLPNVLYLSGFNGSAAVLAAAAGRWALFTDGRYTQQAREEAKGVRVVIARGAAVSAAIQWLAVMGSQSVGFEADHVTVSFRSMLKKALPSQVRLRETTGVVERLRSIKDAEEIEAVQKAVNLGSSLLDVAVKEVGAGIRECDVAAQIEYTARRRGAEGMSFETIVAGGVRSALPHGRASSAPIPRKGFVVMDFGVILGNYCSDMTRTVYVGRPSSAERAMYGAVLEAQQAAVESVRPGIEAGAVDEAARKILRRAKLAKFFTHSTGHGVGLEIHEQPRIARGVTDVLQSGMVITIEPGVYIPGRGGIRIEDMVLVTPTGREVLTGATKEFIAI